MARLLEQTKYVPSSYLLIAHLIFLVDNTLRFHYTSSQSRGLSHQVTRNLALLIGAERQRLSLPLPRWNPTLPPDSPAYTIRKPKTSARGTALEEIKASAWNALGHVVRMAEARDGLILGQVRVKEGLKSKRRKR